MTEIQSLPSGMSLDQLTTVLNDRLRTISQTLSGIQAASPKGADTSGTSSFVLPPRSINAGHFASTLQAILLVLTLPNLPNSGYPPGTVVLNEADGVLYRNNAGTWGTFINITPGSITTTMIAPNAITTPKLAANSITANELAANSVIAGKVAAGAIRASDAAFAAAAIQSADIANAAITTALIANLAVTDAKIASLDVVKLTASGSISTAVLRVSNVGSSGIITDITQASDPALVGGAYTGISIQDGASGGSLSTRNRISVGPYSVSLITSSGVLAAYISNSSGYGQLGLKNPSNQQTISLDASTPQLQLNYGGVGGTGVKLSVNSSGVGSVAIANGVSITYFAPWINANGKRMVWGSTGNFNGGTPAQATVSTGLAAVESFTVTVVAPTTLPEYAFTVSASGGSVTFESSNAASTRGFNWFATGT